MPTELTPEQTADLEKKQALVEALLEVPQVGKHDTRFSQEVALVAKSEAKEQVVALIEAQYGKPVKPAGESTPGELGQSAVVRAMGGIRGDQTLYLHNFSADVSAYVAFWPWGGGATFTIKIGVYRASS